jgi:hypothetical protein
MMGFLSLSLRIAGAGLIVLALMHIPIGRRLQWAQEYQRLSPGNAAICHVHNLFICLMLVLMGLPSLLDPGIFLIPSRAGLWLAWSLAFFWGFRLYCQWFVYHADLWRGKHPEARIHWFVTVIWTGLTTLYTLCGCVQAGWLV